MTELDDQQVEDRPKAPVEHRSAELADVNVSQRIVTAVVSPYEVPALVVWRDEMWTEVFDRAAYAGIEKRPNRVRANREHDRRLTCGKAVKFFPSREEGLVAEIRLAQTPLGDETLQLAIEQCLSISAGFAALPSGQQIDRRSKTRRIVKAFLDHISFVESPAYVKAEVLSVRENELILPDDEPFAETPRLDAWLNDPIVQAANKRLGL